MRAMHICQDMSMHDYFHGYQLEVMDGWQQRDSNSRVVTILGLGPTRPGLMPSLDQNFVFHNTLGS